MKYRHLLPIILASLTASGASGEQLFSYSTPDGKSGLRLALRSGEGAQWSPIGDRLNFVSSDFGPWGAGKKMFSPRLFVNAADSAWTCVWEAMPDGSVTPSRSRPTCSGGSRRDISQVPTTCRAICVRSIP